MKTTQRLRRLADKCDSIAESVIRPDAVKREWRDEAKMLRETADLLDEIRDLALDKEPQ